MLCYHPRLSSQSCLPEGITFTTQAQIDSFPIVYPNCTAIEGGVQIVGNDIENLNGLNAITSIGGGLKIWFTENLQDLTGLDNLTHIESTFVLSDNESLSSISSLSNLNEIGSHLDILYNPQLLSLSGLENATISGFVSIVDNDNLIDLSGLDNLEVTGWLIIDDNDALVSLTGLEQLSYVALVNIDHNNSLQTLSGLDRLKEVSSFLYIAYNNSLLNLEGLDSLSMIGSLEIEGNDALQTLSGIDNVESIANLYIGYNPQLSICDVQSICNYLANPNGSTVINYNDIGCNSPAEVVEACIVSIPESPSDPQISIYPNPFTTSTTCKYTLEKPSDVTIIIYNSQGQVVNKIQERQDKGMQRVELKAEGIPQGVYYYKLNAGYKAGAGKLIKMK